MAANSPAQRLQAIVVPGTGARHAGQPRLVIDGNSPAAEESGQPLDQSVGATYLLPFLMVSDPAARELLSYALFLLVVAVVYLQSNMLAINPLLYVLGLRVTAFSTSSGSNLYLISRAAELGAGVLLATRSRQ